MSIPPPSPRFAIGGEWADDIIAQEAERIMAEEGRLLDSVKIDRLTRELISSVMSPKGFLEIAADLSQTAAQMALNGITHENRREARMLVALLTVYASCQLSPVQTHRTPARATALT